MFNHKTAGRTWSIDDETHDQPFVHFAQNDLFQFHVPLAALFLLAVRSIITAKCNGCFVGPIGNKNTAEATTKQSDTESDDDDEDEDEDEAPAAPQKKKSELQIRTDLLI